MERFMEALKQRAKFLENKTIETIIGFIVLLNPLAMAPQLWHAIESPRKELLGVSWGMFLLFATIQIAVTGRSIVAKDRYLFISMVVSVVESLTIATIVFVKTW